jgi:flagellar hook-basal body complex protein FliE
MSDMRIDPSSMINKMNNLSFEAQGNISGGKTAPVSDTFKNYMDMAINGVNKQQETAHAAKVAYTKEDPNVSLSQVMIQIQKAQVALSSLVAVRDKVVEGYKSILNMPL